MSLVYCIGLLLSSLWFLLESKWTRLNTEQSVYSKKRNLIINIVFGFILVVLISANREGYDSISYQRFFNYTSTSVMSLDYTYVTFGKLIIWIKQIFPLITYFEFQALVSIVLGIVVKYRLNAYMLSFRIFCFFYLLSGTIAMDGLQFKNFVAVLFLMIAIPFLTRDGNNVRNTILYVLFIIIATLFHFSFAIYIFLVMIRWWDYERVEKYAHIFVIIGFAAFSILYIVPSVLPRLLNIVAMLPYMSKLGQYVAGYSGKRALVSFFLYFLQLAFMRICVKNSNKLTPDLEKFTRIIWTANLIMGIFLPGLLYANAGYRLFRNVYIVNFIVFSNHIVIMRRLSNNRIVTSIAIMVICLSILIYPNFLLRQNADVMGAMLNGKFFWIK